MTRGAFRFLESSRPFRVDVAVVNADEDDEEWDAPVTLIRTNVSERPFIIDSIREYLSLQDLAVERMVYPMLDVERDDEGRDGGPRADGRGSKESVVHCEVERVGDAERLGGLESDLSSRSRTSCGLPTTSVPMLGALDQVVEAVRGNRGDCPRRRTSSRRSRTSSQWLKDGGFVFLGYRGYDLSGGGRQRAGDRRAARVRSGAAAERGRVPLRRARADFGARARHARARAQRAGADRQQDERRVDGAPTGRMDYVGVKKLDAKGLVVGEHRFVGLFTSKAYSEPAANIPLLRDKLSRILDCRGRARGLARLQGDHHDLRLAAEGGALPLFPEELQGRRPRGADGVQRTGREGRAAAGSAPAGVSVMVILPRDRFSGASGSRSRGAASSGTTVILNYHLALGGGDQARLHFYLSASEERIAGSRPRTSSTWSRRSSGRGPTGSGRGWRKVVSTDEARDLAHGTTQAMSREYQAAAARMAVADICELERMAVRT